MENDLLQAKAACNTFLFYKSTKPVGISECYQYHKGTNDAILRL